MYSLLFILLINASIGYAANNCDREQLQKGFTPVNHVIFGIGLSGSKDKILAKNEARERAYQDIISQLRSNVETSMKLEETDKSSAYQGIVSIKSKIDKMLGIKFFKESSDFSTTSCMAYTFDVKAAYKDAIGVMKVLDKKLEDVLIAEKKKNYVDVIRKYEIAKKDINDNEEMILRADMYKTYLNDNGISWWEKFKTAEVNLDKTLDEAKGKIVFYINEFPKYDEVALEAEVLLGGLGFTAQKGGQKPKTGIEIELKEAGLPKKIKTALGKTTVYKFGVIIRDIESRRVIGTNKGATVQGFSTNGDDDEALVSASKQMSLNVLEAIKTGLPGLIKEDR